MHISRKPIPERRCALTGTQAPKADLLRFALAPDGTLVPDLKQSLPGRGFYLGIDKQHLAAAQASGALAKAVARHYKRSPKDFSLPDDLAGMIDRLYVKSVMSLLGLERKAGRVFLGADSVEKAGAAGKIAVFINAADGAGNSHKFLARAKAAELPMITVFGRDDLSLAFGRENVVHAALADRGAWRNILKYAQTYAQFLGLGDERDDS